MSKVQTKSGKVSGLPSGRKASGGLGKVSVSGGKASGVQSGRKASGVKAPVPGGKASGLQSGGKISGLQSGKVSAGRGRAAGDGTANHYLPRGVLTVNVIDATDLKGRTTLPGAYDPYVKITVGEQTASTREAKNAGSKPSWNQAFGFPLKLERNVISPIRVQVYDRSDSTEQSLMGEVSVDLADIPERKTAKSWKHTDSKNLCLGSEADRGQIRLSIAFQQKTAAAANMSATPVKDQSGNSRGSGSTSGSISGTVEEEEEEGGGFPLALDALEVVALGIGFAAEVYALASSGKDEEDDGETEEGESNKRDPDEEEAEEAEPNQRDADEEEFEPEEAESTQRDADEEEEPQEPEPNQVDSNIDKEEPEEVEPNQRDADEEEFEPEEAESNQRDADEEEFEPEEAESNQRDADEAEFEPEEAESTQRDPDEEEEPQEPEPNQVDSNVDKEEPEEGEPNSNKSH